MFHKRRRLNSTFGDPPRDDRDVYTFPQPPPSSSAIPTIEASAQLKIWDVHALGVSRSIPHERFPQDHNFVNLHAFCPNISVLSDITASVASKSTDAVERTPPLPARNAKMSGGNRGPLGSNSCWTNIRASRNSYIFSRFDETPPEASWDGVVPAPLLCPLAGFQWNMNGIQINK